MVAKAGLDCLRIDVGSPMQGRAHVGLPFAGVVSPRTSATEAVLSRVVAKRMRTATSTG